MNTTIRRILATSAATGALCLATAVPAAAQYEAGSGPQSVTREGYVSDGSIQSLRTGMGAMFVIGLAGAGAVALRRHAHHPELRVSGRGGPQDKISDFDATPRAGLA